MRSKVLTVLASLLLWGSLTAAPALASGSGTTSRGGLTCNTSWRNTWGGANCHGKSKQKWRLKVACAFQTDYTGSWHYGPGRDSFECNFSIQNANVQWG